VEQQWTENRFTAEGRAQHDRVDRPEHETRDGIRYEYAVLLRSLSLGLIGKADAVEFHENKVFPVEHKRGRPKPIHCDWVQLCAQALCLEEMLGVEINEGAIFYGLPRRRQPVEFTPELRAETQQTAIALHKLIQNGKTPPAKYNKKKCDACSLLETCMPKRHRSVTDYLTEALSEKEQTKS
jgi:CRISPR-associated exonuclease Cas4